MAIKSVYSPGCLPNQEGYKFAGLVRTEQGDEFRTLQVAKKSGFHYVPGVKWADLLGWLPLDNSGNPKYIN